MPHFFFLFLAVFLCQPSLKARASNKDSLGMAVVAEYEHRLQSLRQQHDAHALLPVLLEYYMQLREQDQLLATPVIYELQRISRQLGDTRMKAKADFLLGYFHATEGSSDSCLFYLFNAISQGEKLRDDSLLSAASQLVGGFYKLRRKLPEAHLYLDKGIEHAKLSGNQALLVQAIGNKAMAYTWENKPDEAIALHQQILKFLQENKDTVSLMTVHMSLAGAYNMKNNRVEARRHLEFLDNCISSYPLNPKQKTEFLMVGGFLHWEMGNFPMAESHLQQALPMARKQDAKFMLQRMYDTLRVMEESRNNFRKALEYSRLAYQYRDSIAGEKSNRHLKELEVRFQTARKDKELAENRLRIKQHSLYFWISLVSIILLAALSFLLFGYFRQKQLLMGQQLMNLKNSNDLRVMEATIQGEEKERGRIAKDLHDGLAGMLAAVNMHFQALQYDHPGLKESEDFRQVKSLLENAAGEVRKTAHNLMPEMLSEFGLVEAVRRYCTNISTSRLAIQFFAMGDQRRFSSNFELSVYRIIQELIHNIVKHARATHAMVQMSFSSTSLDITVEDNGIGLGTVPAGEGLGFESLKNRVAALGGNITWDKNERNETSVFLEFSIKENE